MFQNQFLHCYKVAMWKGVGENWISQSLAHHASKVSTSLGQSTPDEPDRSQNCGFTTSTMHLRTQKQLKPPQKAMLELLSKSYHPGQRPASMLQSIAVSGVTSPYLCRHYRALKFSISVHFRAFHGQAETWPTTIHSLKPPPDIPFSL